MMETQVHLKDALALPCTCQEHRDAVQVWAACQCASPPPQSTSGCGAACVVHNGAPRARCSVPRWMTAPQTAAHAAGSPGRQTRRCAPVQACLRQLSRGSGERGSAVSKWRRQLHPKGGPSPSLGTSTQGKLKGKGKWISKYEAPGMLCAPRRTAVTPSNVFPQACFKRQTRQRLSHSTHPARWLPPAPACFRRSRHPPR